MSKVFTWSPDHPHANQTTWTEPGGARMRQVVWTWALCSGGCGARTAVVQGAAGAPICDACFPSIALQPIPQHTSS